MYQTAELNHDTKAQAQAAGVNVKKDFGVDANQAFNSEVLMQGMSDLDSWVDA